ncbi:MAG: hypothetical protein JXA00_06060 [Candidatus Thermoplasmatota archaeon]|nr:hypothetical protein [Candidatus Thermoplasmatota archaeon]
MRKRLVLLGMSLLVIAVVFIGSSQAGENNSQNNSPGPAPNSGDGIPDGSGLEPPYGPQFAGNSGNGYGPGPAPNSGDGIPDGPGW